MTMDPLVERARGGDPAALEALLRDVAPAIHRFGLRMCRNAGDAEDVLQDALLSIAQHLGEFEGRSSLSSWAFALARSACVRRRRGLKNRPHEGAGALPDLPDTRPSPEEHVEEREVSEAVSRALDALPEDYREVIVLRDVEGLTAPEAAAVLAISVDATKSRLHRAREALRGALGPVLEKGAPPPSAGCPDVAAMWSRKLEGELSALDCAQMEKHLDGCAACRGACSALKRALFVCQSAAGTAVTPQVQARVKAAVRQWSAQRARGAD
jgi:RNA polymerase sigma-70 factor (ECF subfamily)